MNMKTNHNTNDAKPFFRYLEESKTIFVLFSFSIKLVKCSGLGTVFLIDKLFKLSYAGNSWACHFLSFYALFKTIGKNNL